MLTLSRHLLVHSPKTQVEVLLEDSSDSVAVAQAIAK